MPNYAADDSEAIARRLAELRQQRREPPPEAAPPPESAADPAAPPATPAPGCECRVIFDDYGGCWRRVWTRACPAHGGRL